MDCNSYQHWVASQTSSSLTFCSFFIHFIFLAQVPSHYDSNSPSSSHHSTAHVFLQWSNGLFKHPCFANSYFTHSDVVFAKGCLALLLWDSGPCFSAHTPIVDSFLRTLLYHAANWQPSSFDSWVCECIWACLLNSYCVRKNENMTDFSNPSGDVYEMIQSMKRFYRHHTWSNQTM